MVVQFYKKTSQISTPLINSLLRKRVKQGKEDSTRLNERRGEAGRVRPQGLLFWVHAASIGEAQSALILIRRLIAEYPDAHILVTTGTTTSASMMKKQLPENAFHQYYPLDHPEWVEGFLEHWNPNFIFWMESELWPNMLMSIKARSIPTMLVNARLSHLSFRRWKLFGRTAQKILSTFSAILCQSETEARYFRSLGAPNVHVTDNLKYSAQALSFDEEQLKFLQATLQNRPLWVYASTHKGEEILASRVHERLKAKHPDLLTIIVPRHPERREEIESTLAITDLEYVFRGNARKVPKDNTDLYIADTLGELGLFYRLTPIACIGRSFSDDGGGGHNPIEAAKLNCAVLHGPNVQNLQIIFNEMHIDGAALQVHNEEELSAQLETLFSEPEKLQQHQMAAHDFSHAKAGVIDRVMSHIAPALEQAMTHSKDQER